MARRRRPAAEEKLLYNKIGLRRSVHDAITVIARRMRWSFASTVANLVEDAFSGASIPGELMPQYGAERPRRPGLSGGTPVVPLAPGILLGSGRDVGSEAAHVEIGPIQSPSLRRKRRSPRRRSG